MVEATFDLGFLIGLLAATIRLSAPILYASLGEAVGQRSGVLNLSVEGMMIMGAFGGFSAVYFTGNLWLGVLVAMILGGLTALIMAFMSVTARVNQAVAGVMIGIFGWGFVAFLMRVVLGGSYIPARERFEAINIPVLSQIPVLGPILFSNNILVYLAFLIVPILAFLLSHTNFGMKIIAVGENPEAADTLGINVSLVRYLAVIFGGIMAGLGGACLSLAYTKVFSEDIIAGRGWIAIALVVFGGWNPYKILGGVLLFSLVDALQLRLQGLGFMIPYQFFIMLPYLLTVVALIIVSRRATAPASLGKPYTRE